MLTNDEIKIGEWYWCYWDPFGSYCQLHVVMRGQAALFNGRKAFDLGFGKRFCVHVFATELEARTYQTTTIMREIRELTELAQVAANELQRCSKEAYPEDWPGCTCAGPRSNPENCPVCAGKEEKNNEQNN